jgi:nitric oxide dioxygenase
MVGECLLTALKDVLGDAASDEIMQGWKEGYEFLADLLIGIEDNLKKENANKKGKLIDRTGVFYFIWFDTNLSIY